MPLVKSWHILIRFDFCAFVGVGKGVARNWAIQIKSNKFESKIHFYKWKLNSVVTQYVFHSWRNLTCTTTESVSYWLKELKLKDKNNAD